MDCNRNLDTSLVLLSFLEQNNELYPDPEEQINLPTNHDYIDNDGDLQVDGHSLPVTYRDLLHELQNQVQPQLSVNAEEAQAARAMAGELIRIADLLEQRVLSRAANSLTKKLQSSQEQFWASHLSDGVKALLGQVSGFKEFKKEVVEMAFTFVLMKTVCEHAPNFLFGLYTTVVHYFRSH